ncbi:flagellar biosynthetic protein FliO [Cryobacterium sp. CG_9.6]|uniref:flagellar biosynthetic protein FliO n=1 Tax=Cryobacterium sp. CG_9.6 TaxID=2760710 RepID=UPI0024765D4F|nr:flagellar biosynthetic protein FliO [Cryobacterium sp. CG_9.6]MDH6237259.1 flagellar protein FliO/FliZ [Cryobacterium sp. CG_9.6]
METVIVALRVVLSLSVVLALLWYMQRRFTKGVRARGGANLVTVVGRQGLGQKASVVVVDIDGQRLVLGVTEQSVTVLHGSETPVPAEGHAAFARSLTVASTVGNAHESTDIAPPLEFRPRRKPAPAGALGGSILSASTWQQAAAVLRQGR